MGIVLTLLALSCPAMGATTSTWLNPVNGDWTDPANWSTNPNYPNNGFPTTADTYNAIISALGAPYTVTASAAPGSITVESLVVGSPAATVNLTGGTFLGMNGISIDAGTLQLAGATLRNTLIGGSGGQFIPRSGVLDGLTLRHDAFVPNNTPYFNPSALLVRNGLTLDATLNLHREDSIATYTGIQFDGGQTLGGTGRLLLDGDRTPFVRVNGNLTIGAGVTIEGRSEFNYYGSTVTNFGTIRALPGPREFWFENGTETRSGNFINRGLVEAVAGSRILLEGTFNNSAGTIRAIGGTVDIGYFSAGYKTADLGTLALFGGGTISLGGIIDNTNATINVPSVSGSFILAATVNNGTLAGVSGAQFTISRNATIKGTTITGNVGIDPLDSLNGSTLNFSGITLNGGKIHLRSVNSGAGANAILRNVATTPSMLGGSGEIVFEAFDLNELSGGNLTLAPGIIVRTGSGGGTVGAVINQGTIIANNPNRTLTFRSSQNDGVMNSLSGILSTVDMINRGTVTADAGVLKLGGTWTNQAGTIRAIFGSTVHLLSYPAAAGSFSVTDSTLSLESTLTTAQLNALSISNSIIALEQNGLLTNTSQTFTITNGNSFRFRRGRVNGGTLASATSEPYFVDTGGIISGVTLTAPVIINPGAALTTQGTLNLQNVDISINSDARDSVLVPDNTTISGTGSILFNGGPAAGRVVGSGMVIGPNITIRTQTAGGMVGQGSAPFTNQGTISSPNKNLTLQVAGGNWTNDVSGTLQASNEAVITIAGSWTNKGSLRTFDRGVMNVGGPMTNVAGATASVEDGGVMRLNTNAGAPATANIAARTNLAIRVAGVDSRLVLGADQDLGSIDLALDEPGNPGIDLASPLTVPRILRIHPSDFESAWGAMDAAIHAYLATGDRGIFDSNLRSGTRLVIVRQLDAHRDPMIRIQPARIGDLNLDNSVTIADFIDLASNIGLTNATWREGDLNDDNTVTIADFFELASNFNMTYSGQSLSVSNEDQLLLSNFAAAHAVEVPEPAAAMLVFSVICLPARRRRR